MREIRNPVHQEEEEGVVVVVEGWEEASQTVGHLHHVAHHLEDIPLVVIVVLLAGQF